MQTATDSLSAAILTLQGNGDYDGVKEFMDKYGTITPELQSDLDRLAAAGIYVDVTFRQGWRCCGRPEGAHGVRPEGGPRSAIWRGQVPAITGWRDVL